MSLELLTKAVEDHGTAVKAMGAKTDEALDGISQLNNRMFALEQKTSSGADFLETGNSGGKAETAIKTFIGSSRLKSVQDGALSTGRVELAQCDIKALVNDGRGQTADTAVNIQPQRAPGIVGVPTPALTLLDVLPILKVEGATYEYVHLDGFLSGADYQRKEGDEKAEVDLPTTLERAEIATIAAWLPASKQVLEDNTELENQIGLLMSTGVRQKLERELIAGAGGPGEIEGLISQVTPLAPTLTHPADRVGEAITTLKAAGWMPTVVVMSPADWFTIASERASTGDGQYVLGSPRDPSPPSLWGVPVVVTVAMPIGQALVLDTTTLALLDRHEVTVEASRYDGNNFRRNLVTILAELRAGLAVYAPTANLLVPLA